MARKDDAPAISLFSFQDIITSLTGIMFLVVLLLVLCMMDMHKKDDPSRTESARLVSEAAAKRVKELQTQIAQLRKQEQEFRTRLRELQKLDLDSLWIRLEKLRREHLQQLSRNRRLAKERETLKEQQQKIQRQLQELQQISEKETLESAELAPKLQKLKEEFKKRHAQTVKIQKAMKYVVENNTSFSPILAECTPSGVRIMDCSNGQESDLRIPQGSFETRRQKFLEWVKQRNRNDEYYTILLKPGSADYEELIYDLKALQKNRGLEILPSDDISLWEDQ